MQERRVRFIWLAAVSFDRTGGEFNSRQSTTYCTCLSDCGHLVGRSHPPSTAIFHLVERPSSAGHRTALRRRRARRPRGAAPSPLRPTRSRHPAAGRRASSWTSSWQSRAPVRLRRSDSAATTRAAAAAVTNWLSVSLARYAGAAGSKTTGERTSDKRAGSRMESRDSAITRRVCSASATPSRPRMNVRPLSSRR